MFKEIHSERNNKCIICGNDLGEFSVSNYAHILGKGAYPGFRLYKPNIQQMCFVNHRQWDFGVKSELKLDERWTPVFKMEQDLKELYYNSTTPLA